MMQVAHDIARAFDMPETKVKHVKVGFQHAGGGGSGDAAVAAGTMNIP